jgi:hypothetical protein
MTALQPQIERLATAHEQFAALADAVERGRPWPLSEHFGTEPEASWGPQETLAHVAEMAPFWLGEIERIVDAGGTVVDFGRVADNELRIGVIGRDRTLPPRALFDRVAASVDLLARRLGELDDAAAALRGRHRKLGELSVAEIVDRFLAGHLEEHVGQLRTILDARVEG